MARPDESSQADALEARLLEDDVALLEELADGIARRKLTTAAIFFLESMKPMNFVGATAMVFLRPIVTLVWNNPQKYDRIAKLLEDRGAMEILVRRLAARV